MRCLVSVQFLRWSTRPFKRSAHVSRRFCCSVLFSLVQIDGWTQTNISQELPHLIEPTLLRPLRVREQTLTTIDRRSQPGVGGKARQSTPSRRESRRDQCTQMPTKFSKSQKQYTFSKTVSIAHAARLQHLVRSRAIGESKSPQGNRRRDSGDGICMEVFRDVHLLFQLDVGVEGAEVHLSLES